MISGQKENSIKYIQIDNHWCTEWMFYDDDKVKCGASRQRTRTKECCAVINLRNCYDSCLLIVTKLMNNDTWITNAWNEYDWDRMSESSSWISSSLTCRGAVVAHRCAGAAPVLVGRLGGEAQGAASSSSSPHVLQVIICVIHDSGGKTGGDARLGRHRPGHQTGSVLHLVCPVPERHHLKKTNIKVIIPVRRHLRHVLLVILKLADN